MKRLQFDIFFFFHVWFDDRRKSGMLLNACSFLLLRYVEKISFFLLHPFSNDGQLVCEAAFSA